MKPTTDSNPKVRVVKEFNALPEKVFDAWIDTGMLAEWMFGPKVRDEEIVNLEIDPRKTGKFSFAVRREGAVINHVGTYLELNRPYRIIFTWGVQGESEDESTVTVEITSTENGCRLTLTHELDSKWAEYADQTKDGWTYMLDKLQETFR